ncbi:MAG: pilin [Patescibacteria group bacterium]|nr:pilin [Patescibacteria group bacterium]MDD5490833.1 pilin [Patescibacteria group bacterium]
MFRKVLRNVFISLTVFFLSFMPVYAAIQLKNPLKFSDPQTAIGGVIKAIMGIVGSIALAMFIYGGLIWLTSAGNADKIKKGRDILLWSAIGLVIIFASYILVGFVIATLTQK